MSETVEVDQRVATAREFVVRVFNGHDPEGARDFFTADVVLHGGALGTMSGVDTVVSILGGFIGALTDIDAAEQDVIASGDLVALRQVVSATHTGNLLGVPATGGSTSSGPSRIWRRSSARRARSRSRGRADQPTAIDQERKHADEHQRHDDGDVHGSGGRAP